MARIRDGVQPHVLSWRKESRADLYRGPGIAGGIATSCVAVLQCVLEGYSMGVCNSRILFVWSALMVIPAGGCFGREGRVSQPERMRSANEAPRMLVIVEDRENGKWGYVDYNGKTIIEPRFGFAGEFEGPFAYAVGMDDTRGLIDASGEWAVRVHIPRGFHVYYRPLTVDMIANGLIPIESDRSHEMGYVTATGHVRTDVHFSGAQPFSEGLAWVRRSGETHWFCVNTKGERAFPGSFDYALRFREGRAVVGIQDETGKRSRHLDTEGKFVGEQWWDYVEGFSEGLACVRSKEFHGYVDRSGKRAITLPPQTTDAESFSEGLAGGGM